jgi:hypothetical protein
MQGVGCADNLLYVKCLADAVLCERLPHNRLLRIHNMKPTDKRYVRNLQF